MIINHNLKSLNTFNKFNKANRKKSKSMEKLSSGLRINRASDDSAGLAISQKMKAQIRGLEQAERNIQDGISLLQVGEGGLGEIEDNLQRIRELCVQASNGTLNGEDRKKIHDEINQIKEGINDIAINTEFNERKLFSVDVTKEVNVKEIALSELKWDKKVIDPTVTLCSITTNGSGYAAVGYKGTEGKIYTSNDGQNWIERNSVSGSELYEVKYENGKFIVLGNRKLLTSDDGISWTSQTFDSGTGLGSNVQLFDSIWDGNKFIVVGDSGTIMTSTDGANWNAQNSGIGLQLHGIAYDGSQYVAVGRNGKILTSTDSINWNEQASSTGNSLNSVKWNGNIFVAVGESGTIVTSKDGVNWTNVNSGTTDPFDEIIWNGAQFLGVGGLPGRITQISSSDGVNWDMASDNIAGRLHDVLWDGSNFFSVAHNGIVLKSDKLSEKLIQNENLLNIHVGATSKDNFEIKLPCITCKELEIDGDEPNVTSQTGAEQGIEIIDNAISKVSSERGKLGAYQNSLEHIFNNVSNYGENLTSSESRISDVDMSKEIMEISKQSILEQSAQALLKQAQQMPQDILQLLKS